MPLYVSWPTPHSGANVGYPHANCGLGVTQAPTRPSTDLRSSTDRHSTRPTEADCVTARTDSERMNEEFLPFIGTEALAAGTVTRRTLVSRHDMVYRNIYLPKGME